MPKTWNVKVSAVLLMEKLECCPSSVRQVDTHRLRTTPSSPATTVEHLECKAVTVCLAGVPRVRRSGAHRLLVNPHRHPLETFIHIVWVDVEACDFLSHEDPLQGI